MRILHTVEAYLPTVGGMQEAVRQISERLVVSGHEVTVATGHCPERTDDTIAGVKVRQFRVSGNLVKGMQGEVERYRQFLRDADFDIVTNFAAQQWATDAMLPMLSEVRGRKVFVPTGFSALHHAEYRSYFARMKEWMRQYDRNVFLAENYRDINFARESGLTGLAVIPNGADETEFLSPCLIDIRQRLGIPAANALVLHVGSHTGLKGHREAMLIFDRAATGRATLLLIGNLSGGCRDDCLRRAACLNASRKFRSAGKNIIVASLARDETIAAYRAADLFLFPSNIECAPVVLYEALASQTPILATDVGNAAEIIRTTGAGVLLPSRRHRDETGVADRMKEICRKVFATGSPGLAAAAHGQGLVEASIPESALLLSGLLDDRRKREEMATRGFEMWREHFTWGAIADKYRNLYEELCFSVCI